MTEHVPEWWEKDCDICHSYTGGSHYHCGRCLDLKPTSMMGHYHSIHVEDGAWIHVEGHMSCEPGACENAKFIKKMRM